MSCRRKTTIWRLALMRMLTLPILRGMALIVEACSWGPRLEMFARGSRKGWTTWGDQSEDYAPSWPTYANHSGSEAGDSNVLGSNVVALSEARQAASLSALPPLKNAKHQKPKDDEAGLPLVGGTAQNAPTKKAKKKGRAMVAA
jgi:hypothetical protein